MGSLLIAGTAFQGSASGISCSMDLPSPKKCHTPISHHIPDVIPSPSSPLNLTITPPADSAAANPTSSSDSEVHHISQTPVYCPEPVWPDSNNSNAFTNAVSANPAPGRASIGVPNHPRTTRSRDGLNQSFADTTSVIFTQLPPSASVSYPRPDSLYL